ncbi:MAG: extracellular solute-binding protein [Acholeplasmataceae bacterium]
MKKIFTLIVNVILIFILVACTNGEDSGKIKINFWHMSPVGSPSYSPMRRIINNYNNSQDKVLVTGTGFSFWDYWDKIGIAISSKTTPSLGLSTIDDVEARASGKVLFNLTELIDNDTSDNNIDLDEFRDSQLEFATYNDNLYAMPFSATARALYYNLDIIEEKGFSEEDLPTTWSELKTFAKNFDEVDSQGRITRIGFDPTYGNATYHGWLWQTGLDFFDEDKNPTLNTPKHAEVLDWIKDFNSEFSRNQLKTFGEGNELLGINPFASERVVMIVDDDGLNQKIVDANASFNYGVTTIPIPDEDGVNVNWGSGFSIEMYDNGKRNEEHKLAAFDFLKYLMSKEVQIELAIANGWLMSHISAMEEYTEDKPILKALLKEVDNARDKIYIPYAPSWHGNDWQPFYNAFLDGEKTAVKTLEDARAYYLRKKSNYEATH